MVAVMRTGTDDRQHNVFFGVSFFQAKGIDMKSFISWSTASCLMAAAVSVAWANLGAMQDTVGSGGAGYPTAPAQAPVGSSALGGAGAPVQDGQNLAAAAAAAPSPLARYDNRAQAQGFGQTIAGQQSQLLPTQGWMQAYYSASAPQNEELNSALATWKDSVNDAAARQTAKEKASQVLGAIYDELLNGQEQEIDALEKRVVELREQLGRRRQAKSRMVELKLEMLLSQTDGLGWPSQEARSTVNLYRNPARAPGLDPLLAPGAGTAGTTPQPNAPAINTSR